MPVSEGFAVGRAATGTRRELLGAAAAVAVCAGLSAQPALAATPADDHQILVTVLGIELLLVWSYERVLGHGTIGGAAHQAVARILEQEHQHVNAVQAAAGGTPASVPITLAAAERELARHHVGASPRDLGTQHDCLRLLVDVESVAEGAWFTAIGQLADPRLAATGAAIMASEAQHWTVLSGFSHHDDPKIVVPYPFVRGSSGF